MFSGADSGLVRIWQVLAINLTEMHLVFILLNKEGVTSYMLFTYK